MFYGIEEPFEAPFLSVQIIPSERDPNDFIIMFCVLYVCEYLHSQEMNCIGCEGTLGPAWLTAVTSTKCVSPQARALRVHELLVEEQFWPDELKAIYCCAPWAGTHDTTILATETLDTTISVI